MRVILPILLVLTLVGAYALGRLQRGGAEPGLDPDRDVVLSTPKRMRSAILNPPSPGHLGEGAQSGGEPGSAPPS